MEQFLYYPIAHSFMRITKRSKYFSNSILDSSFAKLFRKKKLKFLQLIYEMKEYKHFHNGIISIALNFIIEMFIIEKLLRSVSLSQMLVLNLNLTIG